MVDAKVVPSDLVVAVEWVPVGRVAKEVAPTIELLLLPLLLPLLLLLPLDTKRSALTEA